MISFYVFLSLILLSQLYELAIINIILLIKILGYYINQLYIKKMINKGAESLPNKDAQAYRQLAV